MHTEDVFDSMVVFSKAQWLKSTTEEAEGEDGAGAEDSLAPGAMPDTVHRVLHQKYSFAGGASGEGGSGAAAARGSGNIRDALESAGHDSDADSDEGGADGDVEVIDVDAEEAGASSSGKLPRRATGRQAKKSYLNAGSSAEEVDSEDEGEAPLGELRRVAASTKPAAKARAKVEPDAKKPATKASKPVTKPKPAAPSAKAPPKPKAAASSKAAPKPKPKRKREKDSDEDDDDDSGEDSGEDSEGFVGDWQPRKVATPSSGNSRGSQAQGRPGRKSTSSYKEESDSDDSNS